MLAAATSALCGLDQRFGAEPGTVLQHHLEAARAAEALHGRRRNGQDIGVLDDRQALAQVGQHRVRGHARKLVIVKRRQAGEDRCCIRRDREGRRIEAGERRHMLDALRPQDDVDRLRRTTFSVRSKAEPAGS